MICDKSFWIADTGCPYNLTCDKNVFDLLTERRYTPNPICNNIGTGISTLRAWDGKKWKKLIIEDLKMGKTSSNFNIISIYRILKKGWWCVFSDGKLAVMNSKNNTKLLGAIFNGVYVFRFYKDGIPKGLDLLQEPVLKPFPNIDTQLLIVNYYMIRNYDKIILDSGASFHSIDNRDYFIDYQTLKKPEGVSLINGKGEIIGIGTVKFLIYNGTKWVIKKLQCNHCKGSEVLSISVLDIFCGYDAYCNSSHMLLVNRKTNNIGITGLFVESHWILLGIKIPRSMATLTVRQVKQYLLDIL